MAPTECHCGGRCGRISDLLIIGYFSPVCAGCRPYTAVGAVCVIASPSVEGSSDVSLSLSEQKANRVPGCTAPGTWRRLEQFSEQKAKGVERASELREELGSCDSLDMYKSEAQIYLQNGLDGEPQQHNGNMEQGKVVDGGQRQGKYLFFIYSCFMSGCHVTLGDEA